MSTTTARCLILDSDLTEVGRGSARHTNLNVSLRQSGGAWLTAFKTAINVAIAKASISPADVASVGIATQGVTSIPVDDIGEPRTDSPQSGVSPRFDQREWYDVSGRYIFAPFLAHKLMTKQQASRWALAGDFLAFQLSGDWVISPALASTTGLVSPSARDWSDELLERAGISRRHLSAIRENGPGQSVQALGVLARELGLSPTTPIAPPTQDQRAAVLMANPGGDSCTITVGSAAAIVAEVDSGEQRQGLIPITPGIDPTSWWMEGVVLSAGTAFDWGARLVGAADTRTFLDMAHDVPPRSIDVEFVPALAGLGSPDWSTDSKAGFVGLDLAIGPEQIARAIVDGVCSLISKNVQEIATETERLTLIGKAAIHGAVPETIATMLDRPVSVLSLDEATATGAALIGAHNAGFLDSLAEGVARTPNLSTREIHPQDAKAI